MGCGGSVQQPEAKPDAPTPTAERPAPAPALIELFGATLLQSIDVEANSQRMEWSCSADILGGRTNILVYFSAHWCPPCRGFTPELAEAYKKSAKGGKDTIVIFVSSDGDEASFKEYYGEMPWFALPFSDRDRKNALSEKFGVEGIPMLVVLSGDGELVTKEGRGEYAKYFAESEPDAPVPAEDPPAPAPAEEPPAVAPALIELFGDKMLQSTDVEANSADILGGRTNIMVYFSAHWCPPCRGFTPVLAEAYKKSAKGGKDTIVIFVSSDSDEASFKEYYGEMPWFALPFSDRDRKSALSEKFGVQGIPKLVVLSGDGELVTAEGRGAYTEYL